MGRDHPWIFGLPLALALALAYPYQAQAAYVSNVMRCVYRNASDDQRWMFGGNIVTERNETGPINLTEAGRPAGVNADNYQVECFGEVLTGGAGNYQFCVDTDDGGYTHILNSDNGTWYAMVDRNTHGQGTWRCTNNVPLSASTRYELRAGYWESGSGSGMKVGWLTPGAGSVVSIPAANLRAEDGFLRAHLLIDRFTGLTTNCSGFTCDYNDWMWGVGLVEPGGVWWWEGMFAYCDSECTHAINTQCGDCGATWNPADWTLVRYSRNKQRSSTFVNLYDDDGWPSSSDCGHVWYTPSTSSPVTYIGSGFATTDGCSTSTWRCMPQMLTWAAYYNDGEPDDRLCPDDDGIEETGGACNSGNAFFSVYYTDTTAPPTPSAPTVADADAPLARSGYDNDLTLTVAWTEVDDANSGTLDYEIEVRQSADATCNATDTLLTTLTASDLDPSTSTNNARTSTTSATSGNYYCARVRARNGGAIDLVTAAPSDGRTWSAWGAFSSAVRTDVRHPVAVDAVPAGGFAPYTTYTTGVLRCYARNRASGNENEQNMDGAVVGECNLAAPISYDYVAGGVTCGAASGENNFNVDCWGEVLAGATGVYTFGLNTDDGGYVMVNNTMVVRDQTYHGWNGANGAYTASGTISLTAGTWYPIRAGFFEAGGGASWELKWTPPAGALANIPAASLRRVNDHWARSADTISLDLIAHDVHSGPLMQNIVLAKSNAPTCGGWSWHDWSSTATNATNEGTCSTYITFPLSGSEIKEASESGGTTFVFRFTPDFLAASNGGDFDISTRNMDLAGDWSGDCTNTPSNDTCDVDTGRNLRIDDDAPTSGAVTPANTATATHVDGTFDLSTTFDDGTRSGMASCQQCKSTDGVCDAEWAAATWSAGTCSVSGLTCTDGQSLTLNMRATDNVGNTGTASGASRTCDTIAPTTTDNGSSAWSASDQTVTLTPADARSGVASTVYCVDTTNTCSPGTSGTSVSVTCAANSVCQQYVRYRSTDNVGNVQAIQTAAGGATIKIDKQGPPTVPGSLAVMLTGNKTLKATWTAASDGTGSGLAATPYAVQIGLTGADASGCAAVSSTASLSASPSQYRTAPAACTLTSMADATQYCFIIRASDAVGNTSDSATVCSTAVIANEDVAGVVKGFPTSATKADGTYIGTFVAANNRVLYLLDANAGLVTSLTLGGAGETFVTNGVGVLHAGAPYWTNESGVNYAYVATNDGSSVGRIYKVQNTDGAPANDPAGNTLSTVAGWPLTANSAACGGATNAKITTAPTVSADVACLAGWDPDCSAGTKERIYCVETVAAGVGGTGGLDQVVDVAGCGTGEIKSPLKLVGGTWAATNIHVGSDCPGGAANTTKLYRIDADAGTGTPECGVDFNGNEIRAWMTGSFGELYFGTIGTGRSFYKVTGSEAATPCTNVYVTAASFPYVPGGLADIVRGARPNYLSDQDEAYFVDQNGILYCVCTKTAKDGGDTCVTSAGPPASECTSVGAACPGFPKDMDASEAVALSEPLFHNGTIYVVSNTGRVYAVEALCDATAADGTAPGTIKSTDGYTYRVDTTGVESTLAVRCTSTASPCPSADTRLTLGTDTGRVFYLPVTP